MSKRTDLEDLYPLTSMQKGIFFLSLQNPEAGLYCEQLVWKPEGDLDPAAFEQAWRQVVARHTILRTCFLWEGLDEPVQVVRRQAQLPARRYDWRRFSPSEQEARLESFLRADWQRGFDLSQAPLMRLAILRLGDEAYQVVWSYHHLLLDGGSHAIVLQEVLTLYDAIRQGRPPALPPSPPFRVYIAWLQRQDRSEAERFWRRTLKGFTAPTPLGVDRLLPDRLSGTEEYAEADVRLSSSATKALRNLASGCQLTLNACVQGAWALLLSRYSGEEDVVFGAIVSDRPPELRGSDAIVGIFLNNVPVRVRVRPEAPLGDWLQALQGQQAEVFRHAHCGLAEIQSWSEIPAGTPLFESYLTFQNYASGRRQEGEGATSLQLPHARFSMRTGYPLSVLAASTHDLGFRISYDLRRFDPATVGRMLDHLAALLTDMAGSGGRRLSELSLLSVSERRQILELWNDTGCDRPPALTLVELLEVQAVRTPDAVAVEFEGRELTFGELNRCGNQLGRFLRRRGAGPEVLVGIAFERCLEMVVGLVGILKSGAAYVPLDPDYPADRLGFMLEDARMPILLSRSDLAEKLPPYAAGVVLLDADRDAIAAEEDGNLPPGVEPDGLAYVIYTSGSTGRPKGAMNTHRALVNRLLWMQEAYRLTGEDRVLQKTPFSFDVSIWEFFWPLIAGARLVLARPGGHRDNAYLARCTRERGITVLHFVPSMLGLFLDEPTAADCASLRQVICSGEALSRDLVERFFSRLPAALDNLYGPTEAAIDVTSWTCPRGDARPAVPIGKPISNLRIHLLDPATQPIPAGVAGELHIGGVGLARGYWRRPDLTAERFVPDPFGETPGARLYRSGDLSRYLPDGEVEFLGRIDHQVKLRGFRIELGEIEVALRGHPGVRDAVVVAREDAPGDKRLVGYLVRSDSTEAALTTSELRRWLSRGLPDYMVPAAFIVLEALPLNASGKVDRRALPAPDHARPDLEETYAAPRTPVEEELAGIWREVLGIDRVGIHDDFFALGGDSMRSIQVLAKARKRGLSFALHRLAERPTVAGLAQEVTREESHDLLARIESGAPFSLLSERDLQSLPEGIEDAYPLTRLQAGMFFHNDYAEGVSAYHDVFSYLVEGPCDESSLREAVRRLQEGHPVLRTSFDLTSYSEPLQLVHRNCAVPLEVEDLQHLTSAEQHERITDWVRTERSRRFDRSRPPLFLVRVDRRSSASFQLTISFHHAILDGWSMASLLRDLTHLYACLLRGEQDRFQAPHTLFRHFVALEVEALRSEDCRDFWLRKLSDAPAAWPPRSGSAAALSERRRAVRDLSDGLPGLREATRMAGVPLKSALLALHLRVLALLAGQQEVVTGIVINNRPESMDGERVLGVLLTALPIRLRMASGSWVDLIRQAAAAERELMPFRRYPLAEVQKLAGGDPVFETVFNFTHFHVSDAEDEPRDLKVKGYTFFEESSFALVVHLNLSPDATSLSLVLEVDPATISGPEAGTIEDLFERALATVAEDPFGRCDAGSLLSPAEVFQLLQEWNDTRTAVPRESGLPELFAVQAARTPEAVALRFGEETLSYGELERRGNRLARYLRRAGVGLETTVGLFLERSAQMVVAMLGIVKAGGAYVPLDLSYPRERLAFMLADSGAPLVLTRSSLAEDLPSTSARKVLLDAEEEAISEESAEGLPWEVGADHLAYVIYTSGSTGQPKGVAVIQRAIARLVLETDYVQLGPADRVAQASNASFDAATFEIWGALLNGACLVGIAKETALSPSDLARELAARRITTLFLTTSLFNQLASEAPEGFGSLHHLLFGGEAADPAKVRMVLERGAPRRLLHVYGPTESTTYASWYAVEAVPREATTVPIGGPLSNTTLFVLDREHGLVPVGVPGELCIGGEGLARGYFGRPELTAEKFIPQPVGGAPGSRLYRTGDRVRRLPDGNLEFLGRIDHQVKLRGFRIELGEIESALRQHAGVEEAVVLVWEPEPGHRRLVAYLQPVAGSATEDLVASVRGHLGSHLPEFMVPSAFLVLPSLPLTPNGKLDRRALPEPERERPRDEDFVAPRTGVETTLAGIWSSVLGVGTVGVHDNFFDLGGDSILSIQIVARANLAGLRLAPHQLFEHQTVAELALVAGTVQVAEAEQGPVLGEVALTPIQRWWLEQEPAEPHHFNQAFLLEPVRPLRPALLERAWAELLVHHDALRLRLVRDPQGWRQSLAGPGDPVPLLGLDLSGLPEKAGPRALASAAAALQASLDLERGPVCRLGLFALPNGGQRLLVVVHHLAVDGVSWRILLEDLERVYGQLEQGGPVRLPDKTTSFQRWARLLEEYGSSAKPGEELLYWSAVGSSGPLPLDGKGGDGGAGAIATVTGWLEEERTRELLQEVGQAYNTQIQEVLLTALLETFDRWTGERRLRVDLEGHGREELFEGVDLSRTVGWFTSMFPVLLEAWDPDPGEVLKSVKEQMRRVPGRGIGYGLLRYLGGESAAELLRGQAPAEVSFNYLGQFDQTFSASSFARRAAEPVGPVQGPTWRSPHRLDVVAGVLGGRLQVSWIYTAGLLRRETVERLCRDFLDALSDLVDHCLSPEAGGYTPSDFPEVDLTQEELDSVLSELELDFLET